MVGEMVVWSCASSSGIARADLRGDGGFVGRVLRAAPCSGATQAYSGNQRDIREVAARGGIEPHRLVRVQA